MSLSAARQLLYWVSMTFLSPLITSFPNQIFLTLFHDKYMRRDNHDRGPPPRHLHLVMGTFFHHPHPKLRLPTTPMAPSQLPAMEIDEEYVSPYTVDDRTRASVMRAQEDSKSIQEVYEHQRDFPRSGPFRGLEFNKPELNCESFLSTLNMLTAVIESLLCLEGAEEWDEVPRLVPENSRLCNRWPSALPVIVGHDRAVSQYYGVTVPDFETRSVKLDLLFVGEAFTAYTPLVTKILHGMEIC